MKAKLHDMASWSRTEACTSRKNEFNANMNEIITAFKPRMSIANKEFVFVADINAELVSRRLANHCAYMNGRYVGRVYLDMHGNIFDSIPEVEEFYEDRVVYATRNSNYSSCTYYYECKYIPELDVALVAHSSCSPYVDPMEVNENNDHLRAMCLREPDYFFVTKNFDTLGPGRPSKPLNETYWNGTTKVVGMMDAMKELCDIDAGVVNVGGNRYIPLDTVDNLREFAKYKAKLAYKSGKVQKKIDELVEAKEFDCTPLPDRMPHEYYNLVCKTNINKINNNLCVIRWTYSYMDESFDGMRVYVDGKDVYACKRNNHGQFIRVALSTLNQKNFASEYNSEFAMDDMTGTRLEWYANIINTLPQKHRTTMLMMFLTDTRIEQLVKLGFGKAICDKLDVSTLNIGTVVRDELKVNAEYEDGKNIYRWIGVNKHQLSKMIDLCNNEEKTEFKNLIDIAKDIKMMFGKDDISSVDNAVFDAMFETYSDKSFSRWYAVEIHTISQFMRKVQVVDDSGVFYNNMVKYMPKLLDAIGWNRSYFKYYTDMVDMINTMGIRKSVKLYPADQNDLHQMHDYIAAVYNLHKSEYQREAFVARMKEIKKMEYENDEFEFCVKTPTKPEDLVIEGLELHHCVKSYIDRVCKGETNVLFIRRKDDVSKPFFTVEVTPDRVIRQVHGFSNRNADTEPNMVEFVSRWARNKRLRVGAFNSLRG
jgi:hypothetical protein